MQPATSVMKASVIWSKIVLIALGRLGVIRMRASLVNGVTKIVFCSQKYPVADVPRGIYSFLLIFIGKFLPL